VQRGLRTLTVVAAVLILTSLVVMATDSWGFLIGTTTSRRPHRDHRAACLIALGIPAGIVFESSSV